MGNISSPVASPKIDSHTAPFLSAESICPLPTLQLLIDDYFTYIHPLIPLPHEPTFRIQLQRRDDLRDRTFLAMVANMVAILVASFPRRPRQIFSSLESRRRFPNAGALIKTCEHVAAEARGPGYLSGKLTLYDALCSYLAAVTAGYMYEWGKARLYLGEGIFILRSLTLHLASKVDGPDPRLERIYPSDSRAGEQEGGIDFVEREMGRRLFWVNYASNTSLRQLGSSDSDILIPPLSRAEPPPPLPVEVDDAWITREKIGKQPADLVSELTGFNLNVQVMRATNSHSALEMALNIGSFQDHDRQKQIILQCLQEVKGATVGAPLELQLNLSNSNDWPSLKNPDLHSQRFEPWNEVEENGLDAHRAPYSRRHVQVEIQKANIYASQLAARSFLIEKYWTLCELDDQMDPQQRRDKFSSNQDRSLEVTQSNHGRFGVQKKDDTAQSLAGSGSQALALERDNIIRDLAVLLSSINQVNMEPNGASFVSICKVR